MNVASIKGIVFDIQRFSISDGPGIRTTVFLKGCNLRCKWCHNPESQSIDSELQFTSAKCALCGACAHTCVNHVHTIAQGKHTLDRDKCRRCGNCSEVCLTRALEMRGTPMDVAQVIDEVIRDRDLYAFSGGGMTVSGGEPMLQIDFLQALLEDAKNNGIHTAVETAGCVNYEKFERLGKLPDLYLFDFKGFDEGLHKKNTGSSNKRILDNLKRLAEWKKIIVRMPLISGVNDQMDEVRRAAEFFSTLPRLEQIELLPYHNFGEAKYVAFGRRPGIFKAPPPEHMHALKAILEKSGNTVLCRGGAIKN